MSRRPAATVSRTAGEPMRPVAPPDYADTFAVRTAKPSDMSAEELVRRGLENAPPLTRVLVQVAWRFVLRFELLDGSEPRQIAGWRIVASEPNAVQIETRSTLMDAALLAWRDDVGLYISTFLHWRRPKPARWAWAVVGPVHRLVGRSILNRLARGVNTAVPERTSGLRSGSEPRSDSDPLHRLGR